MKICLKKYEWQSEKKENALAHFLSCKWSLFLKILFVWILLVSENFEIYVQVLWEKWMCVVFGSDLLKAILILERQSVQAEKDTKSSHTFCWIKIFSGICMVKLDSLSVLGLWNISVKRWQPILKQFNHAQ